MTNDNAFYPLAETAFWRSHLSDTASDFLAAGRQRDLFVRQLMPMITPECEAAILAYKLALTAVMFCDPGRAQKLTPILGEGIRELFVEWAATEMRALANLVRQPGDPALDMSPTPEVISLAHDLADARLNEAAEEIAAAVTGLRNDVAAPFAVFYRSLRPIVGGKATPQEEERLLGPILRALYVPLFDAASSRYGVSPR